MGLRQVKLCKTSGFSLTQISLALLALLFIGAGLYWADQRNPERNAERKAFARIKPFLRPEASKRYSAVRLNHRLAVARRGSRVLDRLATTEWSVAMSDLRLNVNGGLEFIYSLKLGTSLVEGCRIDPSIRPSVNTPSGVCSQYRFSSPLFEDSEDGFVSRSETLELYLGDSPELRSKEPLQFQVGRGRPLNVSGTLILSDDDAQITRGQLTLEDPVQGAHYHHLALEIFSLLNESKLRTIDTWDFKITYPIPETLAAFFDGAPELTLLRLEGRVGVDLALQPTVVRMEGRATVLGQALAEGAVEYSQGEYASVWLRNLSFPAPLSGMCFNVNDALIEIDLAEHRFRTGGGIVVGSSDSFSCLTRGKKLRVLDRKVLDLILGSVRKSIKLPKTIEGRGHLVIDFDDSIVCADLQAEGLSVINLAYFGHRRLVTGYSPLPFSLDGFDPFSDTGPTQLAGKFKALEGKANSTAGWHCWPGDQGPRPRFKKRLLAPTLLVDAQVP